MDTNNTLNNSEHLGLDNGDIPLGKIHIWEGNPRKRHKQNVDSLVGSVASNGILQPVTLRRRTDGDYDLPIGSRRFTTILAIRGHDGVLHGNEYKIVEWDDEKCALAVLAENQERQDFAPIEEGRGLNALANQMVLVNKKVTDDILAHRTGIDRQRVNDLRALADMWEKLPDSWRKQLSLSPVRRTTDKQEKGITLSTAHWKIVRGKIGEVISEDVLNLMEECENKKWTSSKFQQELARKPGNASADSRDPMAEPKYKNVAQGLKTAYRWLGRNEELARQIMALITVVEPLVPQAKKAKGAEGGGTEG